MSPTIRNKYKYFHSTVQRAKDRRQKFYFCRLPFDVRPRSVKLNLSNVEDDRRQFNMLTEHQFFTIKREMINLFINSHSAKY